MDNQTIFSHCDLSKYDDQGQKQGVVTFTNELIHKYHHKKVCSREKTQGMIEKELGNSGMSYFLNRMLLSKRFITCDYKCDENLLL